MSGFLLGLLCHRLYNNGFANGIYTTTRAIRVINIMLAFLSSEYENKDEIFSICFGFLIHPWAFPPTTYVRTYCMVEPS